MSLVDELPRDLLPVALTLVGALFRLWNEREKDDAAKQAVILETIEELKAHLDREKFGDG